MSKRKVTTVTTRTTITSKRLKGFSLGPIITSDPWNTYGAPFLTFQDIMVMHRVCTSWRKLPFPMYMHVTMNDPDYLVVVRKYAKRFQRDGCKLSIHINYESNSRHEYVYPMLDFSDTLGVCVDALSLSWISGYHKGIVNLLCISETLTSLRHLSVSGMIIEYFNEVNKLSLTSLIIHGCSFLSVDERAINSTTIETLDIQTDMNIPWNSKLPNLRALTIGYGEFIVSDEQPEWKATSLEFLDVSRMPSLAPWSRILSRMPNLKELKLPTNDHRLIVDELSLLCPKLERLQIPPWDYHTCWGNIPSFPKTIVQDRSGFICYSM